MRVININKTLENTCRCGSWLQHWIKFSGRQTGICNAFGCFRSDLAGALVQKDTSYDMDWYVIPFCTLHNGSTIPIEVVSGTVLVPVNKQMTCERKLIW
jgi:hypothetical protein